MITGQIICNALAQGVLGQQQAAMGTLGGLGGGYKAPLTLKEEMQFAVNDYLKDWKGK